MKETTTDYWKLIGKKIIYRGVTYSVMRYKPGRSWHALELVNEDGKPSGLKIRMGHELALEVVGEGDREKVKAGAERLNEYKNRVAERQNKNRQNWIDTLLTNSGYSQGKLRAAIAKGTLYAYVRTKGYAKPLPMRVDRVSAQGFYAQEEIHWGRRGPKTERYINGRYVDHIEIREKNEHTFTPEEQ
jgi:hypothetical protein